MTHVALSLSEILSCIFSFLNFKTLQSAACVNRIWFDEATRLLWATSNTKNLIAVETSRRNIYAPKICELTLRDVFSHSNLDLDFRLLRLLRFTAFPGNRDVNLGQYLQPALEEIHFLSWPPAFFLHGINKHCPRLLLLAQTSLSFDARPDLVDFFTSNRSLRCVQFTLKPLDENTIVAVISALSKLPYLEDLTITTQTSMNTLAQLPSGSFASLRRAKFTVGVPALPLLSTKFAAITNLALDIVIETEAHALDALASLPLENLEIRVCAGVTLSSPELLFLQNAKHLRSLIIKPQLLNPMGAMSSFEISNSHFEQIFAKLSALGTLLIWFALDIPSSDNIMQKLGQSCPKLGNVRLYIPLDLMAWLDVTTPLFPNLKFAWVSCVSDQFSDGHNDQHISGEDTDTSAELMAQVLDRHAPNLDRFVALNSYHFRPKNADQLSSLVMRWHGRIKETGQTRHAREQARDMVNR